MLKKGIILLIIILIFIFGSVGVYVNTSSFKTRLKNKLEENFKKALSDEVKIQQMSFSPYAGQIRFKNIISKKYGKVKKVVLNFSVFDLFKQKLVVKSAEIEGVFLTIPLAFSSTKKAIKSDEVFQKLNSVLRKNKIQKLKLSDISIDFTKNREILCKLEKIKGVFKFSEGQNRYKGRVKCEKGQLLLFPKNNSFTLETEFFLTYKQLIVNKFLIVSGVNRLDFSGDIAPDNSNISADLNANISDFIDVTPFKKVIAKINLEGNLKQLSGIVELDTDLGNIAGGVSVETDKKVIKVAKCKCSYEKNNIEISGQYVFKGNHNGFVDLNISGKHFKKMELHGRFKDTITKNYFVKGILIDNYNNVSKFSFKDIYNIKLPVVNCVFPFLKANIINNKGFVNFNFNNFKGKLNGEFLKENLFNGFAYFESFNLFNTKCPKFQGNLVADYKGNVEAKTITLYDKDKGYATGSGKFSKTKMDLDMKLHSLDFKTGLFIVDDIDNLDIKGKISGAVTVKGNYGDISVSGSVSLHNALVFQTVFKTVLADFNYYNHYLTIENILALNGKDGLKGNGIVNLKNDILDFKLQGNNINLVYKPVDFFKIQNGKGEIRVNGTLDNPIIESDLAFLNLALDTKNFGKGNLKLRTKNNNISVSVNTETGLSVNTLVNFQGPLDFLVKAKNLKIPLNNEYTGIFSGEFRGKGNFNQIENLIGEGLVTKGTIFSNTLNIELLPVKLQLKGLNVFATEIKVNYTDSNIALKNASLNLENLKITGEINGSGHLLILNNYLKKEFGVNIKTNYTVNGEVSGTLDKPLFQGNIKTKNGIAEIEGLPFAITNINADCDFDPSFFKIKNIAASYGDGKGTVSGFIAHDGTLEIKALFEKIPFDSSGIYALVDGYLLLKDGIDNEINAKGTLKVSKTYIEENQLEISGQPLEHIDLFDRINLDMTLEVQNASFENEMMQVSLKPSVLSLKGTPNSPILLGTLHLSNESIIAINDIPMKISRGSVVFDNPFEISPFINLTAETEIQGYSIACRIRGNINKNLSVKFNSTPPLEQNELFALLFGSGGISAGTNYYNDPTLSNSTDLTAAGIAMALNNLFSPFQKKVKNKLNVERFQITPQVFNTKGDPSPIITVEKDMSSRLTATYSQTVSGSGENLLQFRYRTSLGNYVIIRKEVDNTFTLEFEFIKKD